MISRRIFIRQLLLLSLLFLLLAVVAVMAVNRFKNRSFQNDLSHAMDISLAAINPERVKNQAQDYSVDDSVDYLRLKEQLLKIGSLFGDMGLDSIYIMSKEGNQIIFLVDSLPVDHQRYSPPGTTYLEPPQEIYDVFNFGRPIVVGPYTDEYGTFLSYFKPIRSFSDNQLVGVIGADIDYSFFLSNLWLLRVYAVAGVAVVYIFVLIVFLYYRSRSVGRQKVEDSERLTKNMIDSLPDFFYVFNREGKCILGNKSLSQVLGYNTEELMSFDYYKLFRAADHRLWSGVVEKVYRDGFCSMEIDLVAKNKKVIPCELNNSLLKDAQGEIVGLVGSGRDISSRRQRDAELLKQKRDIEKINELMVGRELKMVELKKALVEAKRQIKG